ncbi:hypothetical protein [Pseudomonas fragi]|uniref:hypothetical protein n=1 Tax=Pseudomonas fragi TaxID=296 RepID=UPI00147669E2|nr:hypothetical protein [Pseudomonas fragi]NNB15969.1 hypothetical protein [Pseudomonas fragi]NNB18479.1 hypothetical protein [Pseudomonas fragi]
MGYLYSASRSTFFHSDIPYKDVPLDVVAISNALHEQLMIASLKDGKKITANPDGLPMAVERLAD